MLVANFMMFTPTDLKCMKRRKRGWLIFEMLYQYICVFIGYGMLLLKCYAAEIVIKVYDDILCKSLSPFYMIKTYVRDIDIGWAGWTGNLLQ